MPRRPTHIADLEMTRPDGTLFTRIEMEAQIRETWKGHQPKRLKAIDPYGLSPKIAYSTTTTIVILHWLLDEMIRRGEVDGEVLGVEISTPDQYDHPDALNQFRQRLAIAIEQGVAMPPQLGDGLSMTNTPAPPASSGTYTPPAAPDMPGAAAAEPQQPQASASGEMKLPKEDPNREWGKPPEGKKRRTKQEMGEDMLWEKMGHPDCPVAPFEEIYGRSYAEAKKEKILGMGGEFPDLPSTTTATTTQTTQQESNDMNQQPPVPVPPGAPQPPSVPAGAPPQPPVPPGAGMAPPPPPQASQQAPQAQAPQAPPQPPQQAQQPAPHPNAPAVPPPPGMAPPPGPQQGMTMPPMPPGINPAGAPAPQQAAPPPDIAGVDLPGLVNDIVGPLMQRIDALETKLAAIDAAMAFSLRSTYQKAGEYTCESVLKEFNVPVPQ